MDSLAPAQGPYAGAQVEIIGSNFHGRRRGGLRRVAGGAAEGSLRAPVADSRAAGNGIVNVTVTNNDGTSATTAPTACYDTPMSGSFCQFTYLPLPPQP